MEKGRQKCNVLFHKDSSATVRAGTSRNAWSTARIPLALVMSEQAVVCRSHKFNEGHWKWAKALLEINLAVHTLQCVIAPECRKQAGVIWGRIPFDSLKGLHPVHTTWPEVTTPLFLPLRSSWNGCIRTMDLSMAGLHPLSQSFFASP